MTAEAPKMDQRDVERYRMTVDLNILDHLGINLYSNIAAVLTEAVANAWDADAETVNITIDQHSRRIEIVDDGIGMSIEDMNNKYLLVGYKRREDDPKYGTETEKKRPVMGRKGLGKLSLFSVADVIKVQSAKDGRAHGLKMTTEGIQNAARDRKPDYYPDPLPDEEVTVVKGTRIVLEQVKRQRLDIGAVALRKRVARRFSVIGEANGFKAIINGSEITAAERGDLQVCQFLWTFGDYQPVPSLTPRVVETEHLPDCLGDWEDDWRIKGWVGTATLPKDLDDDAAGNLNSIVVFARGRLLHENILEKINDGRFYTKYLTGQIEAEFLDLDDEQDIITSDRQRLQEDDPRYAALISFLKERLNEIRARWDEWRKKHQVKKAKETSPALGEWLDRLPAGYRASAETLLANLGALHLEDEDDRKDLYRHGILAFERMRLRGSAERLARSVDRVNELLTLLADRDALEATLYRDIVKSRLEAVQEFQGLVDENAKERVLETYLFDHLWLLDPSWERASGSELMESRLKQVGVFTDNMTEKEKLSRVDIAYRTYAGKHIIVELKRAGRLMQLIDLQAQGQNYVDKLQRILLNQNVASPDIEVVFVVGRTVAEEQTNPARVKSSMDAVSPGSRIIHYDTLIHGAQEAYGEYLERTKELDTLDEIVNRI